jgi:hypothetical protein
LLEALEAYSVGARMSMSQMALGRFMREMFGEPQEPWLQYRGPATALNEPPRESTISNTNGANDAPRGNVPHLAVSGEMGNSGPIVATPPAPLPQQHTPVPPPARPLELPPRASEEESQVDAWNAKSYPSVQPGFVSGSTAQAAAAAALGPPPLPGPAVGRSPTPPPMPAQAIVSSQSGPMQIPARGETGPIAVGSQPLPASPGVSGAFQTPGSQSGAAIPQPQLGFASGPAAVLPAPADPNNLSYPRYERSSDGTMAPALDDLKPNRRPLFIGLGVAAAVIVIAVIVFSGGNKPSAPVAAVTPDAPSGTGSSEVVVPVATPDASVVAVVVDAKPAPVGSDKPTPTEVIDDQIAVHIETPPVTGAEVELDGKVLGKTPLDIKVKRASNMGQLTVRLAGYTDETRKVDLSGDFSKVIALVKKEVPPPHHDPVVPHHDPVVPHHDPVVPHHDPKKPDCQKPGPNMDPFKPVCKT